MGLTQRRYIEKFGKEVTIEQDHPLAIAQDAIDAEKSEKKSEKKGGKKGGKSDEGEGGEA